MKYTIVIEEVFISWYFFIFSMIFDYIFLCFMLFVCVFISRQVITTIDFIKNKKTKNIYWNVSEDTIVEKKSYCINEDRKMKKRKMKWKSKENYVIIIMTKRKSNHFSGAKYFLFPRTAWLFLLSIRPLPLNVFKYEKASLEKPFSYFSHDFKLFLLLLFLILDLFLFLGLKSSSFISIFLFNLRNFSPIYWNLLQNDKSETFFHMDFLFFSFLFYFSFPTKIDQKKTFCCYCCCLGLKSFDSPFRVPQIYSSDILVNFVSVHLISIHLICYWILFQHD